MIPTEHKEEVINTGISFMRAITDAFGADEGMALWDSIASTLDSDVKGSIFFTLLTGESGDRITVRDVIMNVGAVNKVQLIKSIRTVTGLGLKEAHEKANTLMGNNVYDPNSGQWRSSLGVRVECTVVLQMQPGKTRSECVTLLRNAGCII